MHPLSRPAPTFPSTIPTKVQTYKVISEALDTILPADLAKIVSDYTYEDVDVALASQLLMFDVDGNVTNPDVRANIKAALLSATCPAAVKAKIFENLAQAINQRSGNGPRIYQEELEKISNEILEEGRIIDLRGVVLNDVTITLNLRNADLTGAHISKAEIFCDCTGANLSNVHFEDVGFRYAKLCYATSTGLKMEYCNFIETEVTGMTITALAGTDLRSDVGRTEPDGEPKTCLFLNGFMPKKGLLEADHVEAAPPEAAPPEAEVCSIM